MSKPQEERKIIKDFVDGGYLKGKHIIEFCIPSPVMVDKLRSDPPSPMDLSLIHNYRIDLLVVTDDAIWIVEGKHTPDLKALGQLLGYKWMVKAWQPATKALIKLGIVCRQDNEALAPLFEKYDIKIWEV